MEIKNGDDRRVVTVMGSCEYPERTHEELLPIVPSRIEATQKMAPGSVVIGEIIVLQNLWSLLIIKVGRT